MKKLISLAVSLALLFGVAGFQIAQAKTDLDTLMDAFNNLAESNYRSTGRIRITAPIEDLRLNANISSAILKIGNEISDTLKFNVNLTDNINSLTVNGSINILKDEIEDIFMKLEDLAINGTEAEVKNTSMKIMSTLNDTIADTYLRVNLVESLMEISEKIDFDIYEILNLLQTFGLSQMEIIRGFLEITNGRIIEITRKGNNFTIRPTNKISKQNAEAVLYDLHTFLQKSFGVTNALDITKSMIENTYEGLNRTLLKLKRTANVSMIITMKGDRISQARFAIRILNRELPLSISGLFRFTYRTSEKIFMPRCFIDMVNLMDTFELFGLLNEMGFDINTDNYIQWRFEETKNQETCR